LNNALEPAALRFSGFLPKFFKEVVAGIPITAIKKNDPRFKTGVTK
jgi:hypothetical protein